MGRQDKAKLSWLDIKEFLVIVILCICWYAVGSANGVLGKWILSEYPFPMTLTLVQLISIVVFSRPMLMFLGIRPMSGVSRKYYWKFIVPLAIAKFVSSVFGHVSIWKVPVSYAHTVKASLPIFTVIISRCLLGETYSSRTYLSLVPIVLGVAIATVSEVSFDLMGMASALTATSIFASMAIVTKKVNDETGIHTLRLLLVIGQLSLGMFLPFWFFFDYHTATSHSAWTDENSNISIGFLLVADGFCYWVQNIMAFTIMNKLSKLSYAVANATKRIVIITTSIILLQNHVTALNVIGMFTAIFGVFLYNKVKLDEKLAKEFLPLTAAPNGPSKKLELWNNNHYTPKVELSAAVSRTNGNAVYFQ